MKNLISAAIIATVALAGAASADITKLGVVIKDGVAVGSIYNSKILDGFSDAEARKFVTDFYAKQKADSIADNDREKRKAYREAGVSLTREQYKLIADLSTDYTDGFVSPEEIAAVEGRTQEDVRGFIEADVKMVLEARAAAAKAAEEAEKAKEDN